MSGLLKVPVSSSEVNEEWLKEALTRQVDGVDEVEVVSLEQFKNKHGVLSSNFKAQVILSPKSQPRWESHFVD